LVFHLHRHLLVTDFFGDGDVVFFRGFLRNWLQYMAFLWSDRGAMRGNRGLMTTAFGERENMQEFELYLRQAVEIASPALQRPLLH
jgi:hypothetical protein